MCQEKHVTREQQDGLAIQIPKAADQERIVTWKLHSIRPARPIAHVGIDVNRFVCHRHRVDWNLLFLRLCMYKGKGQNFSWRDPSLGRVE